MLSKSKGWRYLFRVVLFAILGACYAMLAACATSPAALGISHHDWSQLSALQRQQYLNNYHKQQSEFMHQQMPEEGPSLELSILSGKAMMPPFIQAFAIAPMQVNLAAGSCKQVWLEAATKPVQQGRPQSRPRVRLAMCYRQGVLALDPSHYIPAKMQGTLLIHQHPRWLHGFTYKHLHSSGYVRLQNATIRLQLSSLPAISQLQDGILLGLGPL